MTETREGTDVVERLTFTTRPVGDITMLDFRSGGCRPASDVEIECLAEIGRLRTLLSSSRGEQGWRTIDSAPKDGTEVLGWREDCGPILVRWTSAGDFLTDAEAEESGMTEEQLYEESWFYADFVQGGRLAADEYPTHWMPLPSAPGSVPTSLAGHKILEGLRDAVAGDLPRVTIEGVTYVRQDAVSPEALLAESRQTIDALQTELDALKATSLAGQVPDGYVLVPKAAIRWLLAERDEAIAAARAALQSSPQPTAGGDAPTFQDRVQPWMLACFGAEISADRLERSDRFIEEALELVQASGYSKDRAHQLVEYVFSRDQGEINQEVGGVMVTLAAHCLAHGVDMHEAAERELARVWTKVETIRAKQASKPKGSALPIPVPDALSAERARVIEECARVAGEKSAMLPHQNDFVRGYANGRADAAAALRALGQQDNGGADDA